MKYLNAYINDPNDPEINFSLALEYEEIGQTAPAVSFYIRAAERTSNKLLAYESLIRAANCYTSKHARANSVKGLLQNAIALIPNRPEAYLLLSYLYEHKVDWPHHFFDSYTTACIGMQYANDNNPPLRTDVGYRGHWTLYFQKAHVSWYCGLTEAAREMFLDLRDNWDLPEEMRSLAHSNLEGFKSGHLKYFQRLDRNRHSDIRYNFLGFDFDNNYSEAFQDLFVLCALDGKRNGTYIEIGAGKPYYGNNTALLEQLGWSGVSLDIDPEIVKDFNRKRVNKCLLEDALKFDYSLINSKVIDYLQVDCDPADISLKALARALKSGKTFKVITFEHDKYAVGDKVQNQALALLEKNGYMRIVDNIAPRRNQPFEDWYIHPEYIENNIIDKLYDVNNKIKIAEDYMFEDINYG
jgi:hypothetical protein